MTAVVPSSMTFTMRLAFIRSQQLRRIVQWQCYPISMSRLQDCCQRRCVTSQQTQAIRKAAVAASLANTWSTQGNDRDSTRPSWSEKWENLGLGACLVGDSVTLTNLLFVQVGFGVDQHGSNDATKATVRAVRNAIELNSIPGVIEAVPGGRNEMLIQVKLGMPAPDDQRGTPMSCNVLEVAKGLPYGKLLPIDIVVGGLSFPTGRVVESWAIQTTWQPV